MIEVIKTTIQSPFEKPWGNYLLEKIVETQAPESISWLPQTLGWKFLALAALFVLIRKIYHAYKNYQLNAYRRDALAWLKECQKSDDFTFYKQLPSLLKKTALSVYERTEISHLTGAQWEYWLDQQCQQTSFATTCPNVLHQLAYRSKNSDSFNTGQYQALLAQITLWVKHHRGSNV